MADHSSDIARDKPPAAKAPPAVHADAHDHHGHDHGHGEFPHLAHHFDTPQQQFDAGKLGIWLFLLTEVLFFSGLFCAYTIYRSMRPEVFVYAHYFLDTKLGALNTCVLLISSLTAAWAVRNAQLAEKSKLVLNILITIACACTFMVVKYVEYSHKIHDGLLPGKHFNPAEQVWELPAFRDKHPEAAEYAEKLHKRGRKKEGGRGVRGEAPHARQEDGGRPPPRRRQRGSEGRSRRRPNGDRAPDRRGAGAADRGGARRAPLAGSFPGHFAPPGG